MSAVYQIVASDLKFPMEFSSTAKSSYGVFKCFSNKHSDCLDSKTLYYLYALVPFGFMKIAAAYWNGKAFVKVAPAVQNPTLLKQFLENNEGFVL